MSEQSSLGCPGQVGAAKWAFSTRRVDVTEVAGLGSDFGAARSGDVVLARVTSIGSHARVQLRDGRPSDLFEGDLVVAACGARYASDQFEGIARIERRGIDMLAGGGCFGRVRVRNGRMKRPTRLAPIGMLLDAVGEPINLARYALPTALRPRGMAVIGVVGASMNSGKTSAMASLVHGVHRAGYRVAAIKLTGTAAFGDYNAYVDAGADYVADFTDAGMVSTYLQPVQRIERAFDSLLAAAQADGCEVAVVELADGVLQQETAALLGNPDFRASFAGFVYASADPLSAVGGCAVLGGFGIVPAALTGLICQAPLCVREAEVATGLPVLSRESLCDPLQAGALLRSMRRDCSFAPAIAA